MEIGSNEAIKQAIVGFRLSVLSRHALALEGTKVHSRFWTWKAFQSNAIGISIQPANNCPLSLALFWNIYWMKVSRLQSRQPEFMQKTQCILSDSE